MLVSPANPLGIEPYSYANVFLLFSLKNMLIDHVSENTLYNSRVTLLLLTLHCYANNKE